MTVKSASSNTIQLRTLDRYLDIFVNCNWVDTQWQ